MNKCRPARFPGVFTGSPTPEWPESPLESAPEILFRYPGVLVLLTARLIAVLLLIGFVIDGRSSLPVLTVLTVTSLLFTLRCPQGNDGSDQTSLIALITLTLGAAVGTSFGIKAALIFIAAQSALSYATSGILKSQGKQLEKRRVCNRDSQNLDLRQPLCAPVSRTERMARTRSRLLGCGWRLCFGERRVLATSYLPCRPDFWLFPSSWNCGSPWT